MGAALLRRPATKGSDLERRVSDVIGPQPQIAPKKHGVPSLWQGDMRRRKTDMALVQFA
ncbi:MAG: hypothetical protein IPP88_06865 [Betaproteobacteria bacterium]|nr:hypothetical protein [Betaproteobacteria bacterium]